MTDEHFASTHERRPGWRHAVVGGLVAALAIAAVPLLAGLGGDSSGRVDRHVTNDEAVLAVRAAVGNTAASGSYDTEFDTHSTYPTASASQQCPPGSSCASATGTSTFGSSGHSTVSFDPYVSRIDSSGTYGAHTLYVTSTTIWLSSGDTVATAGSGISLSSFASSVEGALGPSPGALAMIGLASPGGTLNLEQEAVADATPAGTGSVDGANVTYYDVTIDMTKLADTPDLTDVQRETIQAALPLLHQGGYTGTTERIGVDDAGYIREVTATNHFADGSTGTRHTVLSNFGCAAKVSAPDQIAPPVTTTRTCTPPTTTTLLAPTTSTPAAPTTTTLLAPTTTSIPSTSTTTRPTPSTTPAPQPSSTTTTNHP